MKSRRPLNSDVRLLIEYLVELEKGTRRSLTIDTLEFSFHEMRDAGWDKDERWLTSGRLLVFVHVQFGC